MSEFLSNEDLDTLLTAIDTATAPPKKNEITFSNYVEDKDGSIWGYDEEYQRVYHVIVERPYPSTIPQEILIKLLNKNH